MERDLSGLDAPAEQAHRPPFALILSITLTGIMANTLITPATPDIVDDLGVGAAAIGPLLAAATFPGIFLAPVIGVLSDRYGRREVLLPCLAIFGLSGGLAAFAPTYGVLLALRLLQGVGSAGLINLAVVIIGDHWEGTERTKMIGRNAAALTAAVAVLPPIGGALTGLGGWRWSFAPYWIGLVTAVFVATKLPRGRRSDVSLGAQLRATLPFIRSRLVLGTMLVSVVVFALIFGLFLTVIPLYLDDRFGIDATGRGLFLGVPAITSTISALSLARVGARLGGLRTQVFAFFLFAAGFAVIGTAGSLPLLVAGACLYGFGEGLIIPTLQESIASAAPASSRGSVVALWISFTRSGQTIGPVAASAAYRPIGGRGLFLISTAIGALLIAIQPLIRRPNRARDREQEVVEEVSNSLQ
jgi:ACDE family multidrug resistance protein